MKFIKKLLPIFCIFLLSSCSTPSKKKAGWISVGPNFNSVSTKKVKIVYSTKELSKPFGAIGIIYSKYVPANNKKAINREIKKAAQLALRKGSDAVIIRKMWVTEESSYARDKYLKTPHIYIHALAVKYTDTLTKKERNIIKQWQNETYGSLK